MANVLGGAGVFSGPTGPEQMAMNLQALSQSAQNLGNTAQLRIQDLENRRNAFLNFAKANGVSPALMLATPQGEAAAKSILGNNFFGMIGPNKKKWEAFFNMPMSEEDWNAFSTLEYKKGNLTPPVAPRVAPKTSGMTPPQVAPAQTSVPLSAAPSAPAPVRSSPVETMINPIPEQSGVPITVLSDASGKPLIVADTHGELVTRAQAINRVAQGQASPEELRRYFVGKTPKDAQAAAQAIVQRMREVGFDPYTATPDPSYPAKVDSTDMPSSRSITTSDYNPDGTLKSSTAAAPATTAPSPASAPADTERAFREELIRRFPEQRDKILRLPLKVLEDNNKPTYDRYFGSKAAGNTGAGADTGVAPQTTVAGVPLSAEPTRRELATVTATVDKVASEAARTWRANPEIQDAGYKANLETAAKMMSMVDPGTGRLEDHPVMAGAVLNFTKQAWRKTEAEIESELMGSKLDAMTMMSKLGAQSTLSALASSQQAMEVLKVVQSQWDSKYKPQIEAHAKAGKKPDEIAKIMATDPAYMAMDRMIQTANARAYGDGSVVTQLYLKDPISFIRALFGAMPTETFVGYGVAPGYGFTESDPTAADALVSTITSELK